MASSGGVIIRLVAALEGRCVVTPSSRGFRFPPKVTSPCVWLYRRFNSSLRGLDEPMLECGIEVNPEAVHQGTCRFGAACAAALRRRRPGPGGKWHLDEAFVEINGVQRYL